MPAPIKLLLYERAVTNAQRLASFMLGVHGGSPRVLREDFSGTAALARAWVALDSHHRALAVDRDPAVTRWIPRTPRLRVRTADASRCRARADVLCATNFAIGYFHERRDLLRYLRVARACLHENGVFVCDLYGGEGCWKPCVQRVRVGPTAGAVPRVFTYEWRQVSADPRTALVYNTISFSWRDGRRTRRINSAFTYHWRLWSIPELRDAMLDAGFRSVDVYSRIGDAVDHTGRLHVMAMQPHDTLDSTFVVYVRALA